MRVDIMLLPSEWFEDSAALKVRSCYVTQDVNGSDHSPLHLELFRPAHTEVTRQFDIASRIKHKLQTLSIRQRPADKLTDKLWDEYERRARQNHAENQEETTLFKDILQQALRIYEEDVIEDQPEYEDDPTNTDDTEDAKSIANGHAAAGDQAAPRKQRTAELLQLRKAHILQHDIFSGTCPRAFIRISGESGENAQTSHRHSLFDTGASGSFMSKRTALDLELRITGEPECITLGDNKNTSSCGWVTAYLHFGPKIVKWNFLVLEGMQQSVIIGIDFLKRHDARIYVKDEVIKFRWHDGGTFKVNCGLGHTCGTETDRSNSDLMDQDEEQASLILTNVVATKNITIKPDSWKRLPVRYAFPEHDAEAMTGTWGLIHDSQLGQGLVPRGITQIASTGNFVTMSNFAQETINIKKGDIVALHQTLDHGTFEVRSLQQTTADAATSPPTKSHDDIEAAIKAMPHLRGIPIVEKKNENLSDAENDAVKAAIIANHSLWEATNVRTAKNPNVKCKINLHTEFTGQGGSRPMNPAQREAFNKIIHKQLSQGIIEESDSAVASTVFLVPKPGSTEFRVVQDYRALNRCIMDDAYPLPLVEEKLASIGKCKYFTSLDLVSAFWQVELDKGSRHLTAFRCPAGLFHYTRMPMGLKSASGVFCRYLDRILGSLRFEQVLSYLDDILIASPTFEQHLDSLNKVLTKLNEAGLTLGTKKTVLAESETKFLGHVVDEDGLRPDPKKLTAIKEMELPQTMTELRAAMGLLAYYRKFIQNFSKVAEPLRKMLQDPPRWKKKIKYSQLETEAFAKLKELLIVTTTLDHPSWDHPFTCATDASISGLGSVLSQIIEGRERVISFASRCLTKHEKAYTIPELEALAMLWSAHVFRLYLSGKKFTFVTDSRAAKFIMENESDKAGGRLLRWRLALQSYTFDVKHRKGKANQPPDYLSRYPLQGTEPYGEGPTKLANMLHTPNHRQHRQQHELKAILRQGKNAFFPPADHDAQTRSEWVRQQKTDPYCIDIRSKMISGTDESIARHRRRFSENDGLLCKFVHNNPPDGNGLIRGPDSRRRSRPTQIVVPETLKSFILHQHHTAPIAGHLGRYKVEQSIKRAYFWKGMQADLKRYLRACLVCQRNKTPRPRRNGVPEIMTQAVRPWHTISIDLVTACEEETGEPTDSEDEEKKRSASKEPKGKKALNAAKASKDKTEEETDTKDDRGGFKSILTVIDIFTRYVIAIPIKSKKATDIAEALFAHVFTKHGRPIRIQSDAGTEFVNKGLQCMYKTWGIQSTDTGGYQPQATCVERFHKFFNACMIAFRGRYNGNWSTYCAAITWAYNSSACLATGGYTPYQLAHGTDPTLLQDLDMLEDCRGDSYDDATDYYRRTANRMTQMYKIVREQQKSLAERNRGIREAQNTKTIKGKVQPKITFKVNDLVLLWEPAQSHRIRLHDNTERVLHNTPRKFIPKWSGPHRVTQVTSAGPRGGHRYHIEHLKRGTIETHPNRLHLFNPWSDEQPSTSPEIDDNRPYQTGHHAQPGSLFLIPLAEPFPFGVGEVIRTDEEGRVYFRWLGNNEYSARGAYERGWIMRDKEIYYQDEPKRPSHSPYYDTDVLIHQSDIICHSFTLTKEKRLPGIILEVAARHPNIWWK